MNMSEIEQKLAALQKKIAAQEEEIARLRGEPHKSVSEQPWQPIDHTAKMSMPPSAVWEMVKAVPDSVMRDIVGDARRASQAATRTPPQNVERGSGWLNEVKFPDRSRQFELMDRIVESQVG